MKLTLNIYYHGEVVHLKFYWGVISYRYDQCVAMHMKFCQEILSTRGVIAL